jgi:AcrR family transcriptional regulator
MGPTTPTPRSFRRAAAARVEDLFERSGASVGSFYHHFGSKPALAAALYLEILERFHRDFLAELRRHRGARAAAGELRTLSPLEYYVLWMGPTLELTRAWLMNVQQKWTWMSAEQSGRAGLLGAEKTLADAAWQALRAREGPGR